MLNATFTQTHPVVAAWIADTQSWNNFAASLAQSVNRYGSLTANQINAALKSAEKHAAKQVAQSKPVETLHIAEAGLAPVLVAFNQAKESGLKRPKMRLDGFELKLAPDHGKNAGHLYVMNGETYLGKITPEGDFVKPHSLAAELAADIDAKLALVGANVMEQAVAYGRRTGNCSCCGRPLTDKDSVHRAMGKVCATRFGLI